MAGAVKALALFSGGLDSALAAKVILDQGVEVEAVHFVNAFLSGYNSIDQEESYLLQKRQSSWLGIKLHILDISGSHLELVRNPSYGYGKNLNPCIDCRILMLKEASSFMRSCGFSFLISGEVLGQRPMSQRRDALNIIDRQAQVKGLLLRPLSAKLLMPSLAEVKGWVNRDRLFDFSGRSRKPQLVLAKKLGIKEYSTPAGGCLLTETEFSRKFKVLLESGKFDLNDVQLLKVGRHFRDSGKARIIVGRDEEDNKHLLELIREADILFKVRDFAGPLTIVRPAASSNGRWQMEGLIESAAKLTARYSKGRDKEKVWVNYRPQNSGRSESILVSPAGEDLIKKLRI